MALFSRLFHGKKEKKIEPMHGIATGQTKAEQDATRNRMESEMALERERREARAEEKSGKPPVAKP